MSETKITKPRRDPSQLAMLAALLFEARSGAGDINPRVVAQDADELMRIGRALANLAVQDCNRGLTDREQARDDRLCERARVIAGQYGATAETGGDPRGYVLKLHLPSGRYNSMGGKEAGWGVA